MGGDYISPGNELCGKAGYLMGDKLGYSIYLAGPVDGVTPEWATEWRRNVKEALSGWTVLNPIEGKDLTLPALYTPKEIVEADLAMVKRADVVLVDWRVVPGQQPLRVGTIMEIVYAKQWGKQIITFGGLPRGYWLKYHTDKYFDTLLDAIEYLRYVKMPVMRCPLCKGADMKYDGKMRYWCCARCYTEVWPA